MRIKMNDHVRVTAYPWAGCTGKVINMYENTVTVVFDSAIDCRRARAANQGRHVEMTVDAIDVVRI